MSQGKYDVVVVGARCAGAATARLLAQKGYRTLLVDRASFPSDMQMSTHLIWQAGVSRLQRWGLLDGIKASGCPPLTSASLDLGEFTLTSAIPSADVNAAYSPRRKVLDTILVEAAQSAGAEFRGDFTVDDVVWDDGRVTGIVGHTGGAARDVIGAGLVIGADGRNSRIARAVAAPTCNELPEAAGLRFSYFSGVPVDSMAFVAGMRRMIVAWPTNDDLTLVAVTWPIDEFSAIREDVERHYFSELQRWAPALHDRVRAGAREDAWLGGAISSFCRRPFGPGWALVGDAGLTMDPITAAGITNALRDAELLATAVDDGLSGRVPLDTALAGYGQDRDSAALPLYHFTGQMAQLAPPTPETMQLFNALRCNQEATDRYFGVFAQTVPVTEFFDPANLSRLMAAV